MDRKSAEIAVRQARKNAEAALAAAARKAAAAGKDFNVPPGFQVDLSGIVKVRPSAHACMVLQIACALASCLSLLRDGCRPHI